MAADALDGRGDPMDLNHLHLHVHSIRRAREFYDRWFGFSTEGAKEDGFLIVRNKDGFDLALNEDPDPTGMPGWYHFGFRLPSREEVRDLHAKMAAEGVTTRPIEDYGSWISFRISDPDGYAVEVYYE